MPPCGGPRETDRFSQAPRRRRGGGRPGVPPRRRAPYRDVGRSRGATRHGRRYPSATAAPVCFCPSIFNVKAQSSRDAKMVFVAWQPGTDAGKPPPTRGVRGQVVRRTRPTRPLLPQPGRRNEGASPSGPTHHDMDGHGCGAEARMRRCDDATTRRRGTAVADGYLRPCRVAPRLCPSLQPGVPLSC